MSTARTREGRASAPLRFAVWVLAAIYLGRLKYNNTLWDLRQLTVGDVVVRSTCIGLTLAFVYWNVAIIPHRIAAILWTGVALLYGAIIVLYVVVEAGVDYADARDPLDRRAHTSTLDADEKRFDSIDGVGDFRFGDTKND